MKKVLISMLVLGVPVLSAVERVEAAGAEAGIRRPSNEIAVSDNIVLTASAVTVFEIQDNSGSVYIVCLEEAVQPPGKPDERVTNTAIINWLPEPTTVALLGLSGFLMRRRKTADS